MKSFKLFVEGMYDDELKGTKDNWAPYHVRHRTTIEGRLEFTVHHQGQKIGHALLSSDGTSVTDVHVRQDHQKRGIATALYKHIEKHIGKPLKRSIYQTQAGDALWRSREKK